MSDKCGCGQTITSEAAWKRHINDDRCELAGMPQSTRVPCPTCPVHDTTPEHIARCAVTTRARTEAKAHGTTYDVPEVATDDLWAHLGHVASPEDATRIVRQVLDLGWRPVVGKDQARLWGER